MNYIEIKHIKNKSYKDFIDNILHECNFVLFSSSSECQFQLGEKTDILNDWDLFPSNIMKDNKMCYFINCFKINYVKSKKFFLMYNSLEEIFDLTDIYRMVFIKNDKIAVECLPDEITIYQ